MPTVSGNVGAVFNGGTITREMVIASPSTSAIDLQIVAPVGAANSQIEVDDDAANQRVIVQAGDHLSTETLLALHEPVNGAEVVLDTASGCNIVVNGTGSFPALGVRGPFNTSGDALQISSGGGPAITGGFLNGGAFYTQLHTAPADAALAAGQVALWFDQTNGAAKLMVKGKSANGTVVTGSVTLA